MWTSELSTFVVVDAIDDVIESRGFSPSFNSIPPALKKGMSSEELIAILGKPTEMSRYFFYGAIPVPEPQNAMAWDYEEIKNLEGQFLRVSVYDGVVAHWFWLSPLPYVPAPNANDGGFGGFDD